MGKFEDLKDENAYLKELLAENTNQLFAIENEMQDTLQPAVLSSQIVQIVLGMQIELVDFIKKKGKSDKTATSAKRLNKLFSLTVELNSLTGHLHSYKLLNRELIGKHNDLAIKYRELNNAYQKLKNAEDFLNAG